jgi:alpha-galactosidase
MTFLDFASIPAFSFRYDGRPSAEFLDQWQSTTVERETPAGRETQLTRLDPVTGLKVMLHVRRFDEFGAVEWLAEIENTGLSDTRVIEEILPLDVAVVISATERLRLHHANGSACRMDDFLPLITDLPPGGLKVLAPVGGRSSNGTLPFMNLQRDDCGLILAVGWSGQWMARLERSKEATRIAVGMERTHLRLHPGEKIRTPRILLLPWQGDDPEVGNNLLRRLLMAHYLPRLDGQLVMPPTAQCLQAYFYLTGQAGEQFERIALPKTAAIGAEAYWIDACWYGGQGEWWQEVGSWTVNRERFPNGLRPISDAARAAGMKFVLWFEPERVRSGSALHREHPEFLLTSDKDASNLLLNLGQPEACRYITDLLSDRIAEHGVDIYRQDFNFDPLPYWQAADASAADGGDDRVGMAEIRYVEGFYALWDELRRRHPGMCIDNCASGGRRIDLETVSRSLPLWPSDFPDIIGLPFGLGLHVGDQCINAGLARWVPLFGGGVWNLTPYSTRGQIIGGFNLGLHIDRSDLPSDNEPGIVTPHDVLARGKSLLDADFPLEAARAAVTEWRSIRPFFLGDFYLLLPLTVAYHDWCAWQFHREDLDAGVAVFLRRHRSPFPTMEVRLKRIDLDAQYEVSLSPGYEEAPRSIMLGRALERLTVTIEEAPGSMLLRYRRVS